MPESRYQATVFPLLALIITIFVPQAYAAPESNAFLEASSPGLAHLEVELRPWSGKDSARFDLKGAEGYVAGGITLPAESADYEIIASDTEGKVVFFGKGSIPFLTASDQPLILMLPPANPEEGRNEGLDVALSRERLVFEAKQLDRPNSFVVRLEVTDPRGNSVKLDPGEVRWGLTDPTHFELIPLEERFEAVLRPLDGGPYEIAPPNVIVAGLLCDVPPVVIACIPNRHCREYRPCSDPWVMISAGHSHTCAIKQSGATYCWGSNTVAELAADKFETCIGVLGPKCSTRPLRVECPAGAPCRFSQISAGYEFTVAIDFDGDTWVWGRGAPTPTRVSAANGTKQLRFEQITAGDGHGCGLLKGGELWCFGENLMGQAGVPASTASVRFNSAVRVLSPLKFSKVAAGGQHTCAMTSSGDGVACWGRDDLKQTTGASSSAFPLGGNQFFFQHFGGIVPILDLAVSATSSCVKLGNGNSLRCWGQNSSLDLTPLGTPDTMTVGYGHVCTVTGQQASCVGNNHSGQLGIGSLMTQASPVTPLPPPTQFSSLTAGTAHTCGLTPTGDAYCWGRTMDGQVGNGASNWSVPEPALITTP